MPITLDRELTVLGGFTLGGGSGMLETDDRVNDAKCLWPLRGGAGRRSRLGIGCSGKNGD